MNVRIVHLTVIASIIALASACPVQAGLILQPAGASTNMGTDPNGYSTTHVIDQSGLSSGYTSLVTDFDVYIASNPSHNNGSNTNLWSSAFNNTTGNFDFDLGGTFTIESFAFWNAGITFQDVGALTLLADNNAAFSTPTTLGSFIPTPGDSPSFADVFTFTPTTASHVRMVITQGGDFGFTQFGEAAFEVQSAQAAVPEPASMTMWAVIAMAGVAGAGWRRRKARSSDC